MEHRSTQLHRRALRLEWLTVSWNVVEAAVATGAGLVAGSTALVAFGIDSVIEVASAAGLLWRLYRAGPDAGAAEQGAAERTALYVVAATFFALAAYVLYDSLSALFARETPDTSTVGLVLALLSLFIMPALALAKQRTARQMHSAALAADAAETWVCAWLSLALLAGVGLYMAFGWWWADPFAALLMLPVIVWQGWETLEDARRQTAD